jgi:hypothetical protein
MRKMTDTHTQTLFPSTVRPPRPTWAALLLAAAVPAQAIDLQPWEVIPPPPGITAVQVAQVSNEYSGLYRHGERQPGHARLSVSTTQLRLVQTFDIASRPALAFIHLPYGHIERHGSLPRLSAEGAGDLTLAFAVWPHADRERGRYLGLAAYAMLPTGSYTPQQAAINPGENRHRQALQIGYHQQFGERLGGFVAVDQVWYGSNPEFGGPDRRLTQKPLLTLQASLQYRVAPGWQIAGSWLRSDGGESALNGLARDDRTRVDRYLIGLVATTPVSRFALQYGADLSTENGFRESRRLALRFTRAF